MVLMKGNKFILWLLTSIAVLTTASAIAQGNKVNKLNLEIESLKQQLENVEGANNVLVDELTKLIGGR